MLCGEFAENPVRHRQARLPVTPNILMHIFRVWSNTPLSPDHVMLWSAFCVGFFGFMRSGEFTCPSLEAFSPDMLSPGDVAVDSYQNPSYVTVTLRHSKNDPFAAGVTIHLGRTGTPLCPVTALLGYLAQRPPSPGPLFIFTDGSPLCRSKLIHHLRLGLQEAGVDTAGYSGHSFRIGAATAAAKAGLSDSTIMALGHLRSSAFQRYIRSPGRRLAEASTSLAC